MSILLNAEELRQVKETVRAQYRQLEWRSFLRVRSDIEPWREDYKIISIEGYAPAPVLVSDPGGRPSPNRLPLPNLARRETIAKFYRFALRYYFSDQEQTRAQRLGLSLQNEHAAANSRSFEEFLERIAANGDASGEAAGMFGDIGLTNIATGSADVLGFVGQTATLVSELPKQAGGSNVGWFDLSSGEATATATEMARDLTRVVETVRRATKNINRCTDVVMAEALWDVATRTFAGVETTRNAIEIARAQNPGVQFRPWYKLDGAGGSGKHRIMGLDATDPDGPQMVIPEEMTQGAPYDSDDKLGMFVNQTITVGGVLVKKPQVVVYMDPTNQA